jgi:hypothetical protein
MATSLNKLDLNNFSDNCFLPTYQRETTKFQKDAKFHSEIFDVMSIFDNELPKTPLRVKEKKYFQDRNVVIQDKKNLIEDHLDRRIELFFQEAILCYNTPFYFEAEGAENQIGTGSKTFSTQAAHSSTFPCLYAYLKDENDQKIESSKFVFLKHSHFYNAQNATVELPTEVNQTDTALDGKINEKKLRDASLKIINDIAEAKISPIKATKRFILILEARLKKMLQESEENTSRHLVVKIYLDHVLEIKENLNNNPHVFDQLMGVTLPTKEKNLREVVYRKKYNLIQQAEFIQSKIAKKIFDAQKQMVGIRTKSFKNVDYRLRYIILKSSKNNVEKRFYERLFCTSLDQLTACLNYKKDRLRTFQNITIIFQEKNKDIINQLHIDLQILRKDLEKLEIEFRSSLFKGLRVEYKNFSQMDFSLSFKIKHPEEAMSRSMVSRLEQPSREKPTDQKYKSPLSQRRKEMTIDTAKKIAETFEIDFALFMPSLITSNY